MSSRLSESPVSRRARSFCRRWSKGPYRRYLEALDWGSGSALALLDLDGALLALLRGTEQQVPDEPCRDIGESGLAVLVGDFKQLDSDRLSLVELLVNSVAAFDQEVEELSHHALDRYRELSLLHDFSEKASSQHSLPELLDVIVRKASAVIRASGVALMTPGPDGGELCMRASVGAAPQVPANVLRQVMTTGRGRVGRTVASLSEVVDEGPVGTIACVPLRTAGKSTGVLLVAAGPRRELTAADYRLLLTLSSLASAQLEHAALTESNARRRELAAIGQLTSAIVHDLKNPLTAIRGFAEMIQVDHVPAQEHAALASEIINNADRIWGMVEEILHFARGSGPALTLQQVTGPELTARYQRVLRLGTSSRIRLEVDLAGLGTMTLDPDRFERVLVNLVRNASEAIAGTGCVRVMGSAPAQAPEVQIVVEDDGPGISEELRSSLFDLFVTSGKPGGTGLGLAIVKQIVEQHQGTVMVTSKPGQGARFVITLPRHPAQGHSE